MMKTTVGLIRIDDINFVVSDIYIYIFFLNAQKIFLILIFFFLCTIINFIIQIL